MTLTAKPLTAFPLTAQRLTALRLGEVPDVSSASFVTWDASADTYTQSLYVDDYTDLAWDAATDFYTRETGNA